MTVIGITGGIGSGKSRVCRYLEEQHHAAVFMADDIGHEVMEPDGCAYPALRDLLGEELFLPDGRIDRKKTGDKAFRDPVLLQKMNGIIHPAVHETILSGIAAAQEEGRELAVIEAALLIEADYRDVCREYWFVHTDREIRMERLLASRDLTREKAEDIMDKQLPDDVFRENCEFELENGTDFEKTARQIDERIAWLRENP